MAGEGESDGGPDLRECKSKLMKHGRGKKKATSTRDPLDQRVHFSLLLVMQS